MNKLDLGTIVDIINKMNKLFELGKMGAKLMNAHKEILKKLYPDEIPPELDIDYEDILKDDTV